MFFLKPLAILLLFAAPVLFGLGMRGDYSLPLMSMGLNCLIGFVVLDTLYAIVALLKITDKNIDK